MLVFVKRNAAGIYGKSCTGRQIPNREFMDALSRVQGTVLEASTEFLFKDSVNAYYFNDKGERCCIGLDHRYIDTIHGDVRVGKYKCSYCGYISNHSAEFCPKCEHDKSLERLWRIVKSDGVNRVYRRQLQSEMKRGCSITDEQKRTPKNIRVLSWVVSLDVPRYLIANIFEVDAHDMWTKKGEPKAYVKNIIAGQHPQALFSVEPVYDDAH